MPLTDPRPADRHAAFDEVLAELVPDARRRRQVALPVCPDCRSFVDAPRGGPTLRQGDRWCRSCLAWCTPASGIHTRSGI
jgi:hypothetical protein